ncbi:cell division protein ZipA [Oceanospirillum sanctuarii]|uniref:cell division protein ZipA n=1 Tax=Oceanospirillum sanctuarii TaxID=1434821 RepID=UPI000A3D4AA9|nr:cell division protein ZipA [Oceanospirillum sanctuarii]
MGLREWLMILGGLILLLIIADGIRRMRKVDQNEQMDEEERARQEQLRRELPSGGARVVKSHDVEVFDDDPIPVLRHEVEIPSAEPPPVSSLYSRASEELTQSLQPEPEEASYPVEPEAEHQYESEHQEISEQDALQPETTEQPDTSYPEDVELHPSEEQLLAEINGQAEAENAEAIPDEPVFETAAPVADDAETYAPDPVPALSESISSPSEDDLHITEFDAVDSSMDDLEPLEPLEQRFAAAKARRLEEEERLALQKQADAEAEAEAIEELDPVKAAARRIQGKHTGPRPSERMKMQAPAEEMSLAERQYIQQQEAAHKAQALKLKNEQLKAEQLKQAEHLKQEQEKAEQEARDVAAQKEREAKHSRQDTQDPLFSEKRTTFKERPVTRKPLMTADEEREQIADADELLVMHVKCKDERGFHGAALLHVVMQCGMQIGDMKVFHRFVKTEDGPQIQFSMMSSVNPGVFDIDQIDELYIPSVSFVMGLPSPGSSQECFTMMLETAKVIVRHLNGELRDEDRSVMTPQTIEHYKQRIQEFERRKQLARMR